MLSPFRDPRIHPLVSFYEPTRCEHTDDFILIEVIMSTGMTSNDATNTTPSTESNTADTLVVVSKVKRMIRERSGLNTSQCCIDALTNKIVQMATAGIESAKAGGRKTVMGKDIL